MRTRLPCSWPPLFASAMAPKGGSKQQSEEDLLLQDFSRNLSAKSSALFFGNAFIVSAIPICELRAGGGGDVAGAARRGGRRPGVRRRSWEVTRGVAGTGFVSVTLIGTRGSPPALPATCLTLPRSWMN